MNRRILCFCIIYKCFMESVLTMYHQSTQLLAPMWIIGSTRICLKFFNVHYFLTCILKFFAICTGYHWEVTSGFWNCDVPLSILGSISRSFQGRVAWKPCSCQTMHHIHIPAYVSLLPVFPTEIYNRTLNTEPCCTIFPWIPLNHPCLYMHDMQIQL